MHGATQNIYVCMEYDKYQRLYGAWQNISVRIEYDKNICMCMEHHNTSTCVWSINKTFYVCMEYENTVSSPLKRILGDAIPFLESVFSEAPFEQAKQVVADKLGRHVGISPRATHALHETLEITCT